MLGPEHFKCIVFGSNARPLARTWPGGVGFRFKQPGEHVLARTSPAGGGKRLEVLRAVFQAGHANQHLCSLVVALVLKYVAPDGGVTVESSLAFVVASHHLGDHFVASQKLYARIAGRRRNRGEEK